MHAFVCTCWANTSFKQKIIQTSNNRKCVIPSWWLWLKTIQEALNTHIIHEWPHWRLQQNCPAPRRSPLRCLLPSVWKLVALSDSYRATSSKQPEPADSAVLNRARPFKSSGTCLKPPRKKGSTWTHTAHTFSTGPLLRICTNARTRRPPDEMEDKARQQAWTCLVAVMSTQLIHNAFLFLQKEKKRTGKITGANSVCHHSSMCFLQCAINEGRGSVW